MIDLKSIRHDLHSLGLGPLDHSGVISPTEVGMVEIRDRVLRRVPDLVDEIERLRGAASAPAPRFEVYEDLVGRFRWRLRTLQGVVIAQGGGYTTRHAAHRSAEEVVRDAPDAPIVDV